MKVRVTGDPADAEEGVGSHGGQLCQPLLETA